MLTRRKFLLLAAFIQVLGFIGLYTAWLLGNGLDDVSRFLLTFTGGIIGLIIGAVITYLVVRHLAKRNG